MKTTTIYLRKSMDPGQPELEVEVAHCEIPLTKGYVALIDADDFDRVSEFTWQVSVNKGKRTQYARCSVWVKEAKKLTTQTMHRFILNASDGVLVDHKNGNGLDNRKENLRIATGQENSRNSRKRTVNVRSIYKGVSPRGKHAIAMLAIGRDGKTVNEYLGTYRSEKDAALAYDRAARIRYGEFARCNFDVDDGRVLETVSTRKAGYSDVLKAAASGDRRIDIANRFQISTGTVDRIIQAQARQDRVAN